MEIKVNTRRHRATADQRMQMVEQFRNSGLSRAAFSQQYGIPLPTLGYWLAKSKRASNLPVPMTFSEIRLAAPQTSSAHTWATEIVAPSGLTVRYREDLTIHDLMRLIRGGRC